jgi:hypothetical protein
MGRTKLTPPPAGSVLKKNHPITQGMTACYMLNEQAGFRAWDSVTRIANGTLGAGISFTTRTTKGAAGLFTAASSNGITTTTNFLDVQTTRVRSMRALWSPTVLPTTTSSTWKVIIGKGKAYGNGPIDMDYQMGFLNVSGAGNGVGMQFYFGSDGTNANGYTIYQAELGVTFAVGTWYDVVATWDGTTTSGAIKIYIDGRLRTTKTATTAAPIDRNTLLSIGRNTTAPLYYFDGYISSVMLWKRPITAEEVLTLYESPYIMF